MNRRKFQFFILVLMPLLVSCSMRGALFATPTLLPTTTPLLTGTPSPLPSPSLTLPPLPTLPPISTPSPLILYRKSSNQITYCTMDDLPQHLDIYRPDTSGPWPVVIFIHGGSWRNGSKEDGAVLTTAKLLNPLGYMVASIDYRLYPDARFPAMIEDAKCAVRFLRAKAVAYNIDPNRFVAWGVSAGGHLAALLGTTDESAGWDVGEYLDQSSRVQGVIDYSGPSDLTLGFKTIGLRQTALFVFGIKREVRLLGSPTSYATADDPPFLILNGDKDPLIPFEHGQAMYDALTAAGAPASLVIVKNGVHGLTPFDENPTIPSQDEIRQIILDFLDKTLMQK